MNRAADHSGNGSADIQPSRRQFIEQMFQQSFVGLVDSRRDELMRLIHHRLFVENATVAAVRREVQSHRRATRIIAVTSGKGGVGKTTVAVNLAVAFAQRPLRVLLFDADLGMANAHVFSGVNPTATLADVVAGHTSLRAAIVPGPAGTDLICGASGVGWLADLGPSQVEELGRELLAVAADYDVLLLDTGAGISASVMHFLGLAGDIIVVATPNLAATLDAYGVIKLARESRITAQLYVIINQSENESDATRAAERITNCASRFLRYIPTNLGWLRRDRAVEQANQNRSPLQISNPGNVNARRISRFAAEILTESAQPAETVAA